MAKSGGGAKEQVAAKVAEMFLVVVANPENIGKLAEAVGKMPNLPTKVMGLGIALDLVAEKDGWKLEKNKVTNHFHVIDPKKVRRGWGSESEMMTLLSGAAGQK